VGVPHPHPHAAAAAAGRGRRRGHHASHVVPSAHVHGGLARRAALSPRESVGLLRCAFVGVCRRGCLYRRRGGVQYDAKRARHGGGDVVVHPLVRTRRADVYCAATPGRALHGEAAAACGAGTARRGRFVYARPPRRAGSAALGG
jgi:hypothetical protein